MKALSKTSKQLKHHQVENIEITEKEPSKKDEKQDKYYQISATVSKNENAIDIETRSAGRFVIAVRPGVSRQGRCSHAIFAARNWAAYALLVENVDGKNYSFFTITKFIPLPQYFFWFVVLGNFC